MRTRTRKLTACFFLILLSAETLLPGAVYALTSGPAQPEMEQFEAAGTGELVDLFTGDLKYSIPLADVDGYPLNLAYQSGTGLEDEAGWVGAGWSLNPGAITRDMRGLPDDFNGDNDKVTKHYDRKEFTKVGGNVVLKPSALAWEFGSASIKVGVYKDNYYGIGAELGASLGFQLSKNKKTSLTAGLDITTDSREGTSITPSLSLSQSFDHVSQATARSLSGSLTYNTRSGLKQVQLEASFSNPKKFLKARGMDFSSAAYFGQAYTPTISNNTDNAGYTFSFDLGPSIFGGYLGVGGAGYYYKEKITNPVTSVPAYGYMNYLNGRKNKNALLDFNREKDGVFLQSTPVIAIPVATPDLFTATSQVSAQQFRPFYGGNYIVFDQAHYNNTTNLNGGLTVGLGNVFKGGARIDFTTGGANTNKWESNNDYLSVGEPAFNYTNKPSEEPIFFKTIGEQSQADQAFLSNIGGEEARQVVINDPRHIFAKAKAYPELKGRGASSGIGAVKKADREKRTTMISYLTASQARKYGLDKTINGEDRVRDYRKANHISEMTVTDDEGKRMVYGIPVYNRTQEDVTFSVATPGNVEEATRTGLVSYEATNGIPDHGYGRDRMFTKEVIPAYATSFLLTGILSPDYVDVTGNGISDDDLGIAVKFNYGRHTDDYRWRAPYGYKQANYNEGFNVDLKDDKGSYAYGVKEVWYLSSIESKTMIAFFETSAREDGMGVTDQLGGRGGVKLQKLDRIKVYSKADWAKNGINGAVPIKTVHFEYDYSLCPELPNNSTAAVMQGAANLNAAKGKLTLKKVYFTFGKNNRGKSNPYEFFYDERLIRSLPGLPFPETPTHPTEVREKEDQYTERQQDRWGSYKHSRYNHLVGSEVKMNNSEFPYALQDNDHTDLNERDLANRFASKWQLNKINTPTGSTLEVEYEADDYAYVQNRRAMQMCFVGGIGNALGNGNTGLKDANGVTIELPVKVNNVAELKRHYLAGADGKLMKTILYRMATDIANNGKYEYVQGYAELDSNTISLSGDGLRAFVGLKKINGKNPVAKAGWQMLKADLPQLAYDSYDNSDATTVGESFVAAIKSIIAAFISLRELTMSFDKIADRKNFSNAINPAKSMVRLYSPAGKKMGGGRRVSKLSIRDNWGDMAAGSKTATYGQVYDYCTKDAMGRVISSGVASYEPAIGNEENPFHEPETYVEKVHWSIDRNHFVEKPYGESYFPAPGVGYSKVTVTSFGDDYVRTGNLVKHTGYIENEFYTARDFPTRVDNLPLEQNNYENNLILKLFSSTYVKRVVTSQGFTVELNDMHGKLKSMKVCTKEGKVVSLIENFYSVEKENAVEKDLNNEVDVLDNKGIIGKAVLGRDVDFVTDMRESVNESIGTSIGAYTGGMWIPLGFIPIYIPYGAVNFNYSITTDSYHSTSAVKVIHKYGILKKVRTTRDGSTSMAENLLWDGETGQVLLTRTENEFNDNIYAFSYPAYMAQEQMAGAYKNLGNIFTNFDTRPSGVVPSSLNGFLKPGDELVSVDGNRKGWIIQSGSSLRFVDASGELIATSGRYVTIRSGYRNLAGASAGAVVCMNDPRVEVNGVRKFQLDVDKKVLEANAILYKDKWQVPVNGISFAETHIEKEVQPYCEFYFVRDLLWTYARQPIAGSPDPYAVREKLFAPQSNPTNLRQLFTDFEPLPFSQVLTGDRDPDVRQFYGQPLSNVPFYVNNPRYTIVNGKKHYYFNQGDVITLGEYKLIFDNVTPEFNNLINFSVPPIAHTPLWPDPFNIGGLSNSDTDCHLTFYLITNTATTPYPHVQELARVTWYKPVTVTTTGCKNPVNEPINPYTKNLLGNWRSDRSFVYTVNREQETGQAGQNGGTNIRKSGYYASFDPFWLFQTNGGLATPVDVEATHPAQRWVWKDRPVYFDQKGNAVESVDALNRYTAALYGYRESVATAIAANARRNEITYDGFEDYYFTLQNNPDSTCPLPRHFDWGLVNVNNAWTGPGGSITTERAHTGKYSYKLTGATSIVKPGGSSSPSTTDFLALDNQGRYKLVNNELAEGFKPVPGKKYVLSMWVYDGALNTNKVTGLNLQINGGNNFVNVVDGRTYYYLNEIQYVPVVEGWKRLELVFTATAGFNLQLSPTGGGVYLDDVRISPFDTKLTSYVFDERTMRLVAKLDENNIATFYEYNDEGTPIRIKKETENGIKTIKENRQFFRQRNP